MLAGLRLRLARPVAIAALRAGASAVVAGRIADPAPLAVPFAPLAAVLLDYTIESHERPSPGARRPLWLPIEGGVRAAPFWLDDGSGRIRVVTESGAVLLHAARRSGGLVRGFQGRRWVARWVEAGDRVRLRGEVVAVGATLELRGSERRPLEVRLG